MMGGYFIDYVLAKNCKNQDAYFGTCYKCGKCGRKFDPSQGNGVLVKESPAGPVSEDEE